MSGPADPYDEEIPETRVPLSDECVPRGLPSHTPPEPTPTPPTPTPIATRGTGSGTRSSGTPTRTGTHGGGSRAGTHRPRPGQIVFGRYLVERELGEGGMGSVWLVRNIDAQAERALKLIAPEIASDRQVRARFRREARVMARLSHPNAVAVFDSSFEDDACFIEMEYVEGTSLNRVLKGRCMPVEWAARFLDQLCDVLRTAHDLDIVHRDLKPSNLMLIDALIPGKETLKVLDFGIAKVLASSGEEEDEVKTQANTFLGSSHYSSPEQIRGVEIDPRSDLYSAGVILYEVLTGQRPFNGTAVMLIREHLSTPPPPFSAKNPRNDVPPEVEQVVLRCLAKDPAGRPQTATELRDEFHRAIVAAAERPRHRPEPGVPPRAATAPPPPPPPPPTPPRGERARWPETLDQSTAPPAPTRPASWPSTVEAASPLARPRRSLAVPIIVVLLLLLAAGAYALYRSGLLFPGEGGSTPAGKDANPTSESTGSLDLGAGARHLLPEWARGGYAPDASAGTEGGWPRKLVKTDPATGQALHYIFSKSGHYLPEGYSPSGDAADSSHWPPILVRDRDGVRFLHIEGDQFRMGCLEGDCEGPDDPSAPPHSVLLTGYYLQETEVTNDEMAQFRKAHADRAGPAPKDDALPDHPASRVSHEAAESFAAIHANGRLPSEAQWEFAGRSRSVDGHPFPWSWRPADELSRLDARPLTSLGNLDRTGGDGPPTVAVGKFKETDATEQGVLDMAGNVREWCRDVYAPYPEDIAGQPAPTNPDVPKRADGAGTFVIRGGSFATTILADARTTHRGHAAGTETLADVGFRVVLEIPDSPGPAGLEEP